MNKSYKETGTKIYELKHFEQIRFFLRKMFHEPDFNEQNFISDGYSRRTFYNIKKNIELYLGNNIQKSKPVAHKNTYIINDLYKFPNNFFADAYMYSSYIVEDIYYYIILLQILGNNNELEFDTICGYFKNQITIDKEINIIKQRLNQLVDLGIVQKVNNKTYKLIPDLLNEIDDILNNYNIYDALSYLSDISIFYYNHSFLSTAGYFLSKSINQKNIIENNIDSNSHYLPENSIFIYRYNPVYSTIDNNILWEIVKAVKAKQMITYEYKTQNNETINYSIIPVAVIIEYEYGKQYCYGYSEKLQSYITPRLDMMSNIKITNHVGNHAYYNTPKFINKVWNISSKETKEKVEILFSIPKDKKALLRRLENTKRYGNLEKNKDGTYTFTIEVYDSLELVPWVNGFGKYAVVNKNVSPALYNKVIEHTKKLQEAYGII